MPDSTATDPVFARHSWHFKFVGWILVVLGTALAVAASLRDGVNGLFVDQSAGFAGLAMALFGLLQLYSQSQIVTCTADGVTHSQWFRGTRTAAWSEIDTAVDRESALVVGCSARGTNLRISRWLPGFDTVVERIANSVDIEKLLAPQLSQPLPHRSSVALRALYDPFLPVVAAAILLIWSSVGQNWLFALMGVGLLVLAAWRCPDTSLEIHMDRFIFGKFGRRVEIPFSAVQAVEIDSTIFRSKHGNKVAQLTHNRIVVRLTVYGERHFEPRTGALVTWIIASRAFADWKAAREHAA